MEANTYLDEDGKQKDRKPKTLYDIRFYSLSLSLSLPSLCSWNRRSLGKPEWRVSSIPFRQITIILSLFSFLFTSESNVDYLELLSSSMRESLTSSRRSLVSLVSSGVSGVMLHDAVWHACTAVSFYDNYCVLYRPFPKQQRKEECLKALKKIELEPGEFSFLSCPLSLVHLTILSSSGVYLPSNPDSILLSIDYKSGTPMQR